MNAAHVVLGLALLLSGCGGCQPGADTPSSEGRAGGGGAPAGERAQPTSGRIQGGAAPLAAVPLATVGRNVRTPGPGGDLPPAAAPPAGHGAAPGGPGESDCIVVIDANPDYGPPPLSVAFSAEAECSGGQPTFQWEFGDGPARSTEMNPAHTYARPGDYTAKVTVTGPGGATASDEIDITVEEEGAEAGEPQD